MDHEEQSTRRTSLSPPRPLYVRKQSNPIRAPRTQTLTSNNEKPLISAPFNPVKFPPRTSSMRNSNTSGNSSSRRVAETPSSHADQAQHRANHQSVASSNGNSSIASERSTVSSIKATYVSDSSSAIMGDFIPITPVNIKTVQPPKKGFVVMDPSVRESQSVVKCGPTMYNAAAQFGSTTRVLNPYEFEPRTPYLVGNHQSNINEFIRKHGSSPAALSSPRIAAHVKNAYSEGNVPVAQSSLSFVPENSTHRALYRNRSESSPTVPPHLRFQERGDISPTRSLRSQHGNVVNDFISPNSKARLNSESVMQRGRQHTQSQAPDLDEYEVYPNYTARLQSRSPSRSLIQNGNQNSSTSVIDRRLAKSPTKTLEDVYEKTEPRIQHPNSPINQPQKRSRSPMKKMFGERGWLGRSPDELEEVRRRATNISSLRQDTSTGSSQKKTGIYGKLKSKLEELAEDAGFSPKNPRSRNDKNPKMSAIVRSLDPPQQAKIFMELELSLVLTANAFLMTQFREGRMTADSIKKVTDDWQGKGRLRVIEFMYDQATQRELVVDNQDNFRFSGEGAGDNHRITSMLYNWKQVANTMAIRTFSDADTVIMKLLFDIEQILELLGATEAIMLQLQQIRFQVHESIRAARGRENSNQANRPYEHRQEQPEDRHSSVVARLMASDEAVSQRSRAHQGKTFDNRSSGTTRSVATERSFDDPYGGIKLVPDGYAGDFF